jgi:hypothetical protein
MEVGKGPQMTNRMGSMSDHNRWEYAMTETKVSSEWWT